MGLIQYAHKADTLYQEQAKEFAAYDVDFFSCYENNLIDSINCETTFKKTFLNVLQQIPINPDWNFMDCGSGLGFPCYLASPFFNTVTGIEVMPELAEISRRNLTKLNIKNFQIINENVDNIYIYILNSINVFYLFNPFINATFKNFVNKVIRSIQEVEREVWFIYVNATQEKYLCDFSDILKLEKSIDDFRKINYYHHAV